jgi:predicted site-specific integrase-resolvase
MTIVALYARVSTKDKGQSTENQLSEFYSVLFIQSVVEFLLVRAW